MPLRAPHIRDDPWSGVAAPGLPRTTPAKGMHAFSLEKVDNSTSEGDNLNIARRPTRLTTSCSRVRISPRIKPCPSPCQESCRALNNAVSAVHKHLCMQSNLQPSTFSAMFCGSVHLIASSEVCVRNSLHTALPQRASRARWSESPFHPNM